MKTISKRILCLIVAVCICCSVLPQIFGVMADATEPELSSKCETVIDIAGKDGSFGEDITDLRTSTSIKFSSAINLSDADIFELNVYIEDIEALKSAITETQYIQFGFSSSSRRATANHAEVDISSQLTQSGWNNICVNKSDFTETNINWNNIYYVFIRFANESIDLSTALTNKVVKIRNICESFAVPLSEGADVTLYDTFLNATLGESADSLISSVGETFKVTTSVTDFTDVSLFNVDLYIPNISSFEAFISDKELRFVLSSEQGSASCKFSGGYSANSIANWYTVKLKMTEFIKDPDFDITKVNEFKIEIIGNENEKLGSAYSLKFGFANVRGIKIISPENSIYGETLSEYIVSQQLLSFGETYADFNFEKSSDYSALGDCENIELDLYVDNYESFINSFLYDKNITSINASLDLILSNGTNTLTWKGIEKLIKKSGWNHIILSVAEADNNGFDINSNFSCINLNIADVDSTLMNPNCDGIIAVDNMVATKGVAEPQLPDNIDNILIEELNVNYGKDLPLTFAPTGGYHARKIIDTALDLSSADYIEFDIYVSDAELLKAYDNLYLSLYPSENGNNGHRADFDFKDQLKNDGWNHIKVKKTSARSRGATGSYPYSIDWTNISAVALMTYQSGAPNVTGTGFAVIANICGTIGEGYCHSLDFGPYPIDFENGANINGKNYKNGDLLNTSGVYKLKYTESDVQYNKKLVLYKLGDANCDNVVNILDLVRLKKKLIGTSTLNTAGEKASDLTLDGKIASDDLVLMRKNLLFDSEFPITSFDEEDMSELVDFTVEVESGREMRVLQLSDTQIIESEQQRTPSRLGEGSSQYKRWLSTKKDENYRNCLSDVIRTYKPDLIIITGDLVYGEFDDSGEALVELIKFMDSFKIPWAPVFGNHDNESYKGADWQCDRLENSDYCLFKQRELTGNGNYTVGLKQDGEYRRVFFMLDSNGCGGMSDESKANGHSKTTTGFGEDQIEWYTTLSQKMRYAQPEVKFSAAFHIQLKVFEKAFAKYGYPTLPFDIDNMEDSAETDFGFMGAKLKGGWDGEENVWYSFKNLGFDSIYVGHEHANSASVVYKGVRLQYGQKSSTYDRANYINSAGELVINSYEDRGTPIIGGTAIPVKTDGSIGIGELLLYEEK